MEVQPIIEEIEVARAAVLDPDGRLLILWRNKNDSYRPDEADLPGGSLEPGETPEKAVIREVREESGLDIAGAALCEVCQVSTVQDDGQRIKRIIRTFFMAFVQDPSVVISPEHRRFEWRTIEEAEADLHRSASKLTCIEGVKKLLEQRELLAVSSVNHNNLTEVVA